MTDANIPELASLAEQLIGQVQAAFADSLKVLWQAMIAVAGVGLSSTLVMKELSLQEVADVDWCMSEKSHEMPYAFPNFTSVLLVSENHLAICPSSIISLFITNSCNPWASNCSNLHITPLSHSL